MQIVFEDNHIIVVIKPYNIPSQSDVSGDLDLLTTIKEYRKVNENKSGEAYVGLVHRLDRPTGGLMVFAKTSKAAERLSKQIQDREFEKKYLAVGVGQPKKDFDHLTHYLLKSNDNTVKIVGQSYINSGAKKAELTYRVLDTSATVDFTTQADKQNNRDNKSKLTLYEVNLLTGRSHQARVQLASLGTPLFGDLRYAAEKYIKGNLGLYSHLLRFSHPTTKEILVFKAYPDTETLPWSLFDWSKIDN